jgi:hypothetical protein
MQRIVVSKENKAKLPPVRALVDSEENKAKLPPVRALVVSEENKAKLSRCELVETVVVEVVLKVTVSLAKLQVFQELAVLHQVKRVEHVKVVLRVKRTSGTCQREREE